MTEMSVTISHKCSTGFTITSYSKHEQNLTLMGNSVKVIF